MIIFNLCSIGSSTDCGELKSQWTQECHYDINKCVCDSDGYCEYYECPADQQENNVFRIRFWGPWDGINTCYPNSNPEGYPGEFYSAYFGPYEELDNACCKLYKVVSCYNECTGQYNWCVTNACDAGRCLCRESYNQCVALCESNYCKDD